MAMAMAMTMRCLSWANGSSVDWIGLLFAAPCCSLMRWLLRCRLNGSLVVQRVWCQQYFHCRSLLGCPVTQWLFGRDVPLTTVWRSISGWAWVGMGDCECEVTKWWRYNNSAWNAACSGQQAMQLSRRWRTGHETSLSPQQKMKMRNRWMK